jgi:hypothetical protein
LADPPPPRLAHLWVRDRAENRRFHRTGGGDPKIRDVEHRAHGQARRQELDETLHDLDEQRKELTLDELKAVGVIVVLEGEDATSPLRVDSLERFTRHTKQAKRPQWLLLSVMPATTESPERATVWISDEYRPRFYKLFEDYVAATTQTGKPKNRALVANIGHIRAAVLEDLWQSDGTPPRTGTHWWELWLAPTDAAVELLADYAAIVNGRLAARVLKLNDRTVAWLRCSWSDLIRLPFTAVPLAEIRRPEFADTIEDMSPDEQALLAQDLVGRVAPARENAPAVCHLDTGIRRSHQLLAASLTSRDVYSVVDADPGDRHGHGTQMAGLGLYGPLDSLLLGTSKVTLHHRLESVKILPDRGSSNDPEAYGVVTAAATAAPETTFPHRSRVFCMPITDVPELPGQPTLWSAAVDALAAGVDIGSSDDGIEVLGAPDRDAARLFVICAGNVAVSDFQADYRTACDNASIADPAQAWNALTVGAHTELADTPTDPSFDGWSALGAVGDLAPYSRTSLLFAGRAWPIKPDICMEGGNVLTDGGTGFHEGHPVLSLRTTDNAGDLALTSAHATSAATAQAARLAAMAMAAYPDYWPETIRGLLPHAARWTPAMRGEITRPTSLTGRQQMLRRYGWGVPTEAAVLGSTLTAVTLVTQDEFVPFDGPEYAARRFRLHRLPWPDDALRDLDAADVTLRVSLSYFIEPTASRRGWRRRYSYASHGLRFERKAPTETIDQFVSRVNREAQDEEDGQLRPSGRPDRWFVGTNQRNTGSLHQDLWEGSGPELADCGVLAVHPIGGWWKYGRRNDRVGRSVRYSLLVSLETAAQDVDLYTPIRVELNLPVETAVSAT